MCHLFLLLLFSPQESQHWYQLKLSGQPIGYVTFDMSQEGERQKHGFSMHMELNRMGSKIEVHLSAVSFESSRGLISMDIEQKLSAQVQKKRIQFTDNTIEIIDINGDQAFKNTLPYAGKLLGFHGIQAQSQKHLQKPGDAFSYQTFSPELAMLMKVTRTFKGMESVRIKGQTKQLMLVEERADLMPQVKKLWLDEHHFPVRTLDQTPFGEAESTLTDKQTATLRVSQELPDEIFDQTMIRANWRLREPRAIDEMMLKVSLEDPSLGFPEFRRENQQVLHQNAKEAVLKISRPTFAPGISQKPGPEFFQANALVNSDHPDIVQVATSLKTSESDVAQVMKYKNWVSENMAFDLGVIMAPASEIIVNRKGTCTEYATLLTALLRAGGYASRFAMGFVYMGGIWGGHAWAEVFLNGHWYPLDAAINSVGFADAARFSFITTSLAQGSTVLNGPGLRLYGNSQVEILNFKIGNTLTQIPPNTTPFQISNTHYRNQGLGLDLGIPQGFQIKHATSVWPSRLIVEFVGRDKQSIAISQHFLRPSEMNANGVWAILEKQVPHGRRHGEFVISSDNASARAFRDGQQLLIIRATVSDSLSVLREFIAKNAVR